MNTLFRIRIGFVSLLFIAGIYSIAPAQKKKEMTRKEHLEEINKSYFDLSDQLWDYVSHIANGEKVEKLDKKRRSIARAYYEEKKTIDKLGDYEGDKVVQNAIFEYIDGCNEIIKNDYRDLTVVQSKVDSSEDGLKNYYDELKRINKKLSEITEAYNKKIISYKKKYFSYSKFDKDNKDRELENKINIILDVYETYTPVYLRYQLSKKMDDKLYEAFEEKDTIKIAELSDELLKITKKNRELLNTLTAYHKDSALIKEYEKVINFQENDVNKTIPQMMEYHWKLKEFEKVREEFASKDKSTLTPDDYDEMDIMVEEMNEIFNKNNIMYNHYIYTRNEVYDNFERTVSHYLAKHIVREK